MAQYAKNTTVSSELSRLEIEKILIRYGAENFAYATTSGKAMIGFSMFNRQVKFILPLPEKSDFTYTPTGRERSENSQYECNVSCGYIDKKKTRDTLKSSEREDNATPTDSSSKRLKTPSRAELAKQAPERNISKGWTPCKTIEE